MKQELKNRILSSIVILPIAFFFVAKGSIFFLCFLGALFFIYLLRMVKNYKK